MQNPGTISLNSIDLFIKKSSQTEIDDYEPYINYDCEPVITKYLRPVPMLENTGIELFEDSRTPALYIAEHTHGIIGCCTDFIYTDRDGTPTHELSVLVAPEYRRHGLGRMLVMQMILIIEENTRSPHVLLTGSNEHFARSCGFSYSHSEHYMTRKPHSQLENSYTSAHYKVIGQDTANSETPDCQSSPHQCVITITRTDHKVPGHHTYRLFCDDSSAAKCTVLECSGYVNLANVYTNKKYRGRRFAGQLISAVAADFSQKKLLLQVSGSNTAAIHAYTEAGFTFLRTFDYYMLDH